MPLVSDFVAGAVEAEINRAEKDHDVVIVEGQGSLMHMAYSGVTLGLLHGSMPDLMVLCHESERKTDTFNYPMFPVDEIIDLYLRLVRLFKPVEFVGISLITHGLSDRKARKTIESFEQTYHIPVTDFFRYDGETIVDRISMRLTSLFS